MPNKFISYDRIALRKDDFDEIMRIMGKVEHVDTMIPLQKGVLVLEKYFDERDDGFFPFDIDEDTKVMQVEVYTSAIPNHRLFKFELSEKGVLSL